MHDLPGFSAVARAPREKSHPGLERQRADPTWILPGLRAKPRDRDRLEGNAEELDHGSVYRVPGGVLVGPGDRRLHLVPELAVVVVQTGRQLLEHEQRTFILAIDEAAKDIRQIHEVAIAAARQGGDEVS